jgi:hypothetical protein
MMMPDLVGEKLELPVVRPVIKAVMGDGALAVNLLQKYGISINVT